MSKRTHPDSGPSKRTRFASPSHLAESSTDFLQDDLDVSTTNSKNARNKDRRSLKDASGYESDSTDSEGEGVVPSRKKKGKGKDDDEDEDMFGGSDDEEEKDKDKKKDKGKEFLNLTDIEGQDFGRKKGNYVGEKDDDDDDEDDIDGKGKRKLDLDSDYDSEEEALKAAQGTGLDGPMAAELTAFNMRSELGEGRMTADGESYSVNDRDPNDQYDRWLEGTDRAAVRKARRAKREQERMEQEREAKEMEESTNGGKREKEERLMREMIVLLERGETVLEGLQRVGAELEKQRKKVVEGDSNEKGGKKKLTWAEKQRERKAVLQGTTAAASGAGSNDMQIDE
jgi:CD2 antigen cytoplasmic tail-binding protein 2